MAEYARRDIPADPETVFETVREITVRQVNVRAPDVTLDAYFIEDLGVDETKNKSPAGDFSRAGLS